MILQRLSVIKMVSSSAQAATVKHYRLDCLNNRNVFTYSSAVWKHKIKVLAGLVSSGGISPSLQQPSSHCAFLPSLSKFPLFKRIHAIFGLGSILKTAFQLNYLLKNFISKGSYIIMPYLQRH